MKTYLRKIARAAIIDEIAEKDRLLKESQDIIGTLSAERNKYKKLLAEVTKEQEVILKYYKVDNIGADGIPPSYLPANDPKLYRSKIRQLNEVYLNETFRELMAFILNFHANMAATGKMKNERGDIIDIDTSHVPHMVTALKSVWELIVAARTKQKEIDISIREESYDTMDSADIEEGN